MDTAYLEVQAQRQLRALFLLPAVLVPVGPLLVAGHHCARKLLLSASSRLWRPHALWQPHQRGVLWPFKWLRAWAWMRRTHSAVAAPSPRGAPRMGTPYRGAEDGVGVGVAGGVIMLLPAAVSLLTLSSLCCRVRRRRRCLLPAGLDSSAAAGARYTPAAAPPLMQPSPLTNATLSQGVRTRMVGAAAALRCHLPV